MMSAPTGTSLDELPPPPPPSPPPRMPEPEMDGFAIAALCLSIVGAVVLSLVFGVLSLGRTKNDVRRGRGMAIAALCITAAWVVVIGLSVLSVWLADRDTSNAASFAGEKKDIAALVDDLESAKNNGDQFGFCSLLTAEYARGYVNGCGVDFALASESGLLTRGDLEVKRIAFHGPRSATIDITEGAVAMRFKAVRRNGTWLFSDVDETGLKMFESAHT